MYRGLEKLLKNPLCVGTLHNNPKYAGALTGFIKDYSCPRCFKNFVVIYRHEGGFGFVCGESECLQDDSNASKSSTKSTYEEKVVDAAHRFGLGSRYVNASLSKWSINASHAGGILAWVKNPKDFLVLIGKPNTGKTYFCSAIANFLMEQRHVVKYYNSHRFIEEIQRAISKDILAYDVVNKMASYDFFILDDLGSSLNTDWQKEMFLDLIDQRYSNSKPTIITSNLNESDLKEVLGERTSRRIFSNENLVITLGPEYIR